MALLEVSDVVAGYGETDILHGVSIAVEEGEIVTIIGPNGCGKSTLLKAVVGLVRVRTGAVTFRGTDIVSQAPEQIVRTGLCYVPQSANVFPSLSIRENLEMGGFVRNDDYRGRIEELFELFPDLARRPTQRAGSLSGGQRQMLAIARALMLDPVLLLLDEPSAGLSPAIMGLVFERIRGINRGRGRLTAGGAERPRGAAYVKPGLRAGRGTEPSGGQRPGAAGQPGGGSPLPGRPQVMRCLSRTFWCQLRSWSAIRSAVVVSRHGEV